MRRPFVILALAGASLAASCAGAPGPTPMIIHVTPAPAAASPGPSSAATLTPTSTPGPEPTPATDVQPDPDVATTAATYSPRDPKAPARHAGTIHEIDLVIDERHNTIAEGFVREVWTFGDEGVASGTVPGPVIRVQVGDTLRIRLDNHPPILPGRVAYMHGRVPTVGVTAGREPGRAASLCAAGLHSLALPALLSGPAGSGGTPQHSGRC
jgi:hypothetical protein